MCHEIADEMGLAHESKGEGAGRRLYVRLTPISDALAASLRPPQPMPLPSAVQGEQGAAEAIPAKATTINGIVPTLSVEAKRKSHVSDDSLDTVEQQQENYFAALTGQTTEAPVPASSLPTETKVENVQVQKETSKKKSAAVPALKLEPTDSKVWCLLSLMCHSAKGRGW